MALCESMKHVTKDPFDDDKECILGIISNYREFSPYANFITANFITANFITAFFQQNT